MSLLLKENKTKTLDVNKIRKDFPMLKTQMLESCNIFRRNRYTGSGD